MDAFTDSELFDDDAPCVPPPETDEATDPLTVSPDDATPQLRTDGVPRRAVYVVAALAVLVVVMLALRTVRPSPQRTPRHGTARSHHERSHALRPRQRIVMHRQATKVRGPIQVSAAKAVVEPPSSSPERPSRNEGVGTGRPTSTPTVGNTEQFGYLGR